ncbi:MAG: hypothetical protein HETSPECPRED_000445 [Heterodermia speciosa]|uniref:CorA-like transporter domain-containing protein n=1 Tax=Heterodermia speciosa TaxID=116794 RepID=A0A8H3EUR6_9LECA|nr:MAG: hypothetical protein HETSPECPRED_000445 [Heterodermia speciosa]
MSIALQNLTQLDKSHQDQQEYLGWEHYPIDLPHVNPITTSARVCDDLLTSLSSKLFCDELKVRTIDIIETNNGDIQCKTSLHTEANSMATMLGQKNTELPRIRIISLHSGNSKLPLRIPESWMRKTMTRYRVDPTFLPVLFSFGAEPNLAESGASNIASISAEDLSRKLSYQIRYTEENKRSSVRPWSLRQTGVYHHHSLNPQFDLFIFIHPKEDSLVEESLMSLSESTAASQASLKAICENPFRIHMLLFSSYLDNWRWYFRYLDEEFEGMNDEALTLDLKTTAAASLSFDKVQSLRDLHDRAISLTAHCKGTKSVLLALEEVEEANFKGAYTLQPFQSLLSGHNESLEVLGNRIRNAIDLLAYALDLQNQETAAKINDHISELTEETTDHSATVTWITLLTLFYLPGSFVSTLYGMNFFYFNPRTSKLVIAKDFWIFVVTWLPLALLTFLGYGALVLRHRPRNKLSWPRHGKALSRVSRNV